MQFIIICVAALLNLVFAGDCGLIDNNPIVCPAGKCCSSKGYCGTSNLHCYLPVFKASAGCQPDYSPGSCIKNPNVPPESIDGRCGKGFGTICPAGKCCSAKGWCGTSNGHCLKESKTYIDSITYGGSGCTHGTVASSISEDLITFTLIFDEFIAETGPGKSIGDSRKNC